MSRLQSSCPHSEISIPMVGPLPLQLAVIEMIELFVFLLHQKYNQPSLQSLHLKVKIRTIGLNTGSDQAWFCVRVKCSDLGNLEPSLAEVLPGFGRSVLEIVETMQRIFPGEFMWIERTDSSGVRMLIWHLIMKEGQKIRKRVEKKGSFSGNNSVVKETSICWKMVQSKEHMTGECENLCNYLHRFKLFSPLCNIQFYLNMWGVVTSSKFEWNSNNRSCLGQRRMAVDIEHFMPSDQRTADLYKIYPKLGCPYTLSGNKFQLQDESIKLTTVAALIPPPLNIEIGSRELNSKCKRLKILLYGPGGLPLILPNNQEVGLCPTTILKLEDYGIAIDETVREQRTDQDMVQVDWCYKLKMVDDDWQDGLLDWDEHPDQDQDHQYTILLVIFLERLQVLADWQVEDDLLLIDSLRHSYIQLLCKQRTKVRKAVTNVLNKLLQNFTKADQKQELVHKAISTISTSIHNVLARSSCLPFQQRCMTMLDVTNMPDAKTILKANMWEMATERYGVSPSTQAQSRPMRRKKRQIESTCQNETKRQSNSFDDLAEAVDVGNDFGNKLDETLKTGCRNASQSITIPENTQLCSLDRTSSSLLEDFVQFSNDESLISKISDDQLMEFMQFLDHNPDKTSSDSCGKPQPNPAGSWDMLGDEQLLSSLDPDLFDPEKSCKTKSTSSKRISMEIGSQLTESGSKTSAVQKPSTSGWGKTAPVRDHLLSEAKDFNGDLEEWLNEFSWDI